MSATLQARPAETARSPATTTCLAAWRERLDTRLDSWVPACGTDAVGSAMRHALLGPGKRLRPLLMLAVGADLGVAEDELMDAGCAVEMVHTASLIIDDLPCMDDGTLRRGRPCTHVVHGQATAILASVALLGQAFRATSGAALAGETRAQCVALLAQAMGPEGLVQGQVRDLARRDRVESDAAARRTDFLKTGALFHAAFQIVATIGRADERTRTALGRFASEFGQAFQLADDIADRRATVAQLGKDVGVDAPSATMAARLGPAGAEHRLRARQRRTWAAAVDALGETSRLASLVVSLLGQPGSKAAGGAGEARLGGG